MPGSPQWQTWRLALLPIAESVLGRTPRSIVVQCRHFATSRTNYVIDTNAGSTHTIGHSPETRYTTEDQEDPDEDSSKPGYVPHEIRARKEQIDQIEPNPYPRYIKDEARHSTIHNYRSKYERLPAGELRTGDEQRVVEGRIQSIRKGSKKLAFIDIVGGGGLKLQVLLNYGPLDRAGLAASEFSKCLKLLKRGDVISVQGYPHRTETGELSIKAMQLPKLLSPCLHDFPIAPINDEAAQTIDKHIVMLSDPESVQVLVRRAEIIRSIRDFFNSRSFVEVQTPILAAAAGGAIARPFETVATEFSDRRLNMRIAPELWLKRLIIGGMSRIFEIGPSFRNEGLDKTHNPEFTTCEFYQTYADLQQLLLTTESLLSAIAFGLSTRVGGYQFPNSLTTNASQEIKSSIDLFKGPYPRMDFIMALNACLKIELPNLASPTARDDLLSIFEQSGIPIPPSNPSLPRLLDKLSSTYLEPECLEPTWIINIPECLSPLSKSFIHPRAPNNQPVAARAELFVQGKEVVNCYEEENSPWEQRRKFLLQQEYALSTMDPSEDGHHANLDEDYLSALEWGLPPTGGWGCGIDRLVMLFTGRERISDVLSFGNLRRVTRGAEKFIVQRELELEKQLSKVRKVATTTGKGMSKATNKVVKVNISPD